jgi:hypothetical protein
MYRSIGISSFVFLYQISSILSMPNKAHNLFRRECGGSALTVLEGSSCDGATQANILACSDNCYDIVGLILAINEYNTLIFVCRLFVHKNPQILAIGRFFRLQMHPIIGPTLQAVEVLFVKSKEELCVQNNCR